MDKGMLVIISGPSGVGKGTICKHIFAEDKNLTFSVSVTTRAPRSGERDGVDYFFRTEDEFSAMDERGEFLECKKNFGKSYGTPKAYVEEKRALGLDVVLDIDVKGAAMVKRKCPDAVSIFIAPPSRADLEKRLRGRKSEKEDVLLARLSEAPKELKRAEEYEYIVVNDVLAQAAESVYDIIRAERLRVSRNQKLLQELQGDNKTL